MWKFVTLFLLFLKNHLEPLQNLTSRKIHLSEKIHMLLSSLDEITTLKKLKYLETSNSFWETPFLTKGIPTNTINRVNLEMRMLTNCTLSEGRPKGIGNLKKREILHLKGNIV